MAEGPPSLSSASALEQWKPLLDQIPLGVVACDGSGALTCYNEHAVRQWGRRPAAGERFTGALRVIGRDGQPLAADAPLARALRTGRAVAPVDVMIERPDGSYLWVESIAAPLHDAVGAFVGAIEVIRERVPATLRARMEVEPIHQLTDLTRAFRQATHALAKEVEVTRSHERDLRGELDRLRGNLELFREPVDLAQTARDVAERFATRARQRSSPITITAPPPVLVSADHARLDLVVSCLVDHALDHGRGHPIDVTVTRTGATALLSVREHGRGYPAEEQAHLFEHARGGGLDLAVTRQLVEAMEGRIEVLSEPGRGSTFTVELPAA
jgi:signal transduction histidine kinase